MVIEIKKITIDDLEFINNVRNIFAEDFLHDSRKFTLEETIDWFNKYSPDYYVIFIEETRIGYFRLSNYSEINKNIYIGADIHTNYQGKGYANMAYKKFIPFLFDEYNLNKISLEVLETNQRAINLYKKLGFIEEGRKRQEVLKGNKFIDSKIMSILRDEFKK